MLICCCSCNLSEQTFCEMFDYFHIQKIVTLYWWETYSGILYLTITSTCFQDHAFECKYTMFWFQHYLYMCSNVIVFPRWLLINNVDPAQELQWLIDLLQEAEDNGEKVGVFCWVSSQLLGGGNFVFMISCGIDLAALQGTKNSRSRSE